MERTTNQSMTREEFYCQLVESFSDGVYYVDRQRRILFWNQGAEEITGYDRETLLGTRCYDNILRHLDCTGRELCKSDCPLQKTIEDGQTRREALYLHHKTGRKVLVYVTVSPLFDEQGFLIGAVELFIQQADQEKFLEQFRTLENLAFSDELTNLANRRFAKMNLLEKINYRQLLNQSCGLLLVDLDYFKAVNDNYGHSIGDRVLMEVAKILLQSSRKMDLVARWGGEEFMIIIPEIEKENLLEIAERMREAVAENHLNFDGEELQVTVSIGGAMLAEEDSVESWVQKADEQLYNAKRLGRNQVSVL